MALATVEIPFSLVKDHKSVRCLNATEAGAYWLLVQACLVDGMDPLPKEQTTLQYLSRCTPKRWLSAEIRVQRALNDTLGILKTGYRKKLSILERRKEYAVRATEASLIARRKQKLTAIDKAKLIELTEEDSGTSVIQPVHHSQNIVGLRSDRQAIENAREKLRQSKSSPNQLLTETKKI